MYVKTAIHRLYNFMVQLFYVHKNTLWLLIIQNNENRVKQLFTKHQ